VREKREERREKSLLPRFLQSITGILVSVGLSSSPPLLLSSSAHLLLSSSPLLLSSSPAFSFSAILVSIER
jgi:hypothetical protein